MARRTRRLVPVGEMGLMPMPESTRICFGPSFSISLFRKSMQLFDFGRAGFPLDADINVFGVFAEDDDVHALGVLHGRGNAGEIAHRAGRRRRDREAGAGRR